MRKMIWVVVVSFVVLALTAPAVGAATPVQASTETPTPVSNYYTTATLSSGNTLLVERRITLGDLFVGFSALGVSAAVVATALPGAFDKFFKR